MSKKLALKPMFEYHTQQLGMNPDDVKADAVFTIIDSIMRLSNEERSELGITDNFFETNQIYDMLPKSMGGNGQIKFEHVPGYGQPDTLNAYYNILIDLDGDGFFLQLNNVDDPTLKYTPLPLEEKFKQKYPMSPNELKEENLQNIMRDGKEERNKIYNKLGLSGFAADLDGAYYNFLKFERSLLDLGQNTSEKILREFGVDLQMNKFQKLSQNILLNEAALREAKRTRGDQFVTSIYGTKGETMTERNILFDYISENEGGYKSTAYETMRGNGDWTVGHGLSLKDETVKSELAKRGYDVDSLIAGDSKITYKDSVMIATIMMDQKYNMVKDKAAKFGIDITGDKNSYLAMAMIDLAYQGLLGDRFMTAMGDYIKTGDRKFIGEFEPYIEGGLRGSDARYASTNPTVFGELANDGTIYKNMRMGGVYNRMNKHKTLIEMWLNGQHTNLLNLDFTTKPAEDVYDKEESERKY